MCWWDEPKFVDVCSGVDAGLQICAFPVAVVTWLMLHNFSISFHLHCNVWSCRPHWRKPLHGTALATRTCLTLKTRFWRVSAATQEIPVMRL